MKYTIRTTLAAAAIVAAFYFSDTEYNSDVQAAEIERQYERMAYTEMVRGDAEAY